jgi:hypothetical protein
MSGRFILCAKLSEGELGVCGRHGRQYDCITPATGRGIDLLAVSFLHGPQGLSVL